MRSIALLLLAIGCGNAQSPMTTAPTSQPPAPASAAATNVPAADAASPEAPPETPAANEPPVEPSTIKGYVRVMGVPQTAKGSGVLTEVTVTPRDEYLSDLRLTVAGKHTFRMIVPRALRLPFAKGEQVSFRSGGSGGGPNWRGEMVLLAADGSLLLATMMTPEGWKVERGRRVETDRGSIGYVEHHHEVRFEHGPNVLTVSPGEWDRLADFYVWGAAAVRTPTSAKLPPDYVGGWLDFAIVRAR